MPLPSLSNKSDADRRVIVLQRWQGKTLILNIDFADTDITPQAVAEAIASNHYTADEIAEVWELFKGEPGREITDECYAVGNHMREIEEGVFA